MFKENPDFPDDESWYRRWKSVCVYLGDEGQYLADTSPSSP